MKRRIWLRVAPLLLMPGCDRSATIPMVPAVMYAYTPTAQEAVVGQPVAVAPTVRVTDGAGQGIKGVNVTFAVTHGGGSVTTQATTGEGGVAAASSWVMGTVAQENGVTASAAGLAPVVFYGHAAPGPPAVLQKVGGDGQRVTLGAQLLDSLSVRVLDSFGNPVPGVVVQLGATAGELSALRVTTGVHGIARVALALPIRSGTFSVFASVGDLPSQVFQVTVDPALWMQKLGDSVYARLRHPMPDPPAVRVLNEAGWPVANAYVSFAGVNPALPNRFGHIGWAFSGTDGVARSQISLWLPGPHHFAAFLPGMNPVYFTAFGLNECEYWPYTLFTRVRATVYWDSCWFMGEYRSERFTTTVTRAQCVELSAHSSTNPPKIQVMNQFSEVLAANENGGGSDSVRLRVRLEPGTYWIGVGVTTEGTPVEGFPFELTSRPVPEGEPCST